VVPLIESFQDQDNLYLVMEYMVGGDFLSLLMRMEMLSEEMTQFYVAEMVLCVEEIHRMKWIHRDVKPDNFLISSSGHLKISDFGLSFDGHWAHNQKYYNETRNSLMDKLGITVQGDTHDLTCKLIKTHREDRPRPDGHLVIDQLDMLWKRKLARTIVGTSQYMAPEVILGQAYDGRCD
jgi:protein-serine/threonine kinase